MTRGAGIFLVLLLSAGGAGFAEKPAEGGTRKPESGGEPARLEFLVPDPEAPGLPAEDNLRVSFRVKLEGFEREGSFLTSEANASNYVASGELPFEVAGEQGKKIEYRNFSVIVNCLPSIDAREPDWVSAQFQFEVSGPVRSPDTRAAPASKSLQLQTSVRARLGRRVLVVDEPDKRIEVKIERVD